MYDQDFDGAKCAILRRGQVLTILRDDRDDIVWPNHWDLPGGGRQGAETPFETVSREIHEEVGLTLPEQRVFYSVRQINDMGDPVYFFAALWDALQDDDIRFGNEGQRWEFMPVEVFLEHNYVIPHLKTRLRLALTTL